MNQIFRPKLFSILRGGYSAADFSRDALSGVIVGIVALPLAIAFAVASGVSPEKGIITAIIAGFIISALGGSRVQIGGPTGAFIVIVFGIVQQYGAEGLLISTVLAGILLIVFGLLRLGSLLRFIPHPLIVGFTSGIALVIFSTQIKDALGLQITNLPADFAGKWMVYFQSMNGINPFSLGITLITIIITLSFKRISTKVPGSFVAIIAITLIAQIMNIQVETIGSVFGEIPRTISLSLPEIDWGNLSYYLAPALTIALLGGIESLLSAVVSDGMIGDNHRSNTELIAQGIANVITPLFGGIPATGAIARTVTNVKNGGRTPVAGMIHAVVLLLIMLLFAGWASLIPMSCLAGILIVVAYNMSEWRSFLSIMRGSAFDIIVLLVTFVLTVVVDLTVAIQVGIVLSALLFMKRMADAGTQTLQEVDADLIENYSHIPSAIGVYEVSGPFFFGSAKHYVEAISSLGSRSKVLIIRMRHVPFVDATGIRNLKAVIRDMQGRGTKIILSGVNDNVRKDLDKNRISFLVGKANVCPHFDLALQRAQEVLKDISCKPKAG